MLVPLWGLLSHMAIALRQTGATSRRSTPFASRTSGPVRCRAPFELVDLALVGEEQALGRPRCWLRAVLLAPRRLRCRGVDLAVDPDAPGGGVDLYRHHARQVP